MVPKIIWMLWLQGWESAPDVVQACLRTWRRLNPGWSLNALSATDLENFLDDSVFDLIRGKDLQPETISDVIRLGLLRKYGGVWADATLYCVKPLDEWLEQRVAPTGFFAFSRPAEDRLLSSWFLAADKGNYVVNRWWESVCKYWQTHESNHRYFWMHDVFRDVYNTDHHFMKAWNDTPEEPAAGPHYFLPYERTLHLPVSNREHEILSVAGPPVLKLTHKLEFAGYPPDSTYRFLCKRLAGPVPVLKPASPKGIFGLRRGADRPKKVLVAWYGSFDGHGTIGDYHSMCSVVTHLVGRGHEVLHASSSQYELRGARRVDWRECPDDQADVLLFVCGPVIKGHLQTDLLLERFMRAWKVGVGVSLMVAGANGRIFNPFDDLLAREGHPSLYEDLAIVSPMGKSSAAAGTPHAGNGINVGVVFRGAQAEYGMNNCSWQFAQGFLLQLASQLVATHGGRVIKIENHLERAAMPPSEIDRKYRECDLILTTRFHGGILALRSSTPFIAVDQIKGGAKVNRLIGRTGWPFNFRLGRLDYARILKHAEELIQGKHDDLLMAVRESSVARANCTLNQLDKVLESARRAPRWFPRSGTRGAR